MKNEGKLFEFLSHWAIAIPVLLVFAALSIAQLDLYPPSKDEFFSMVNAGVTANVDYSPLDVVESLRRNTPNHMPGYFVVLSAWGNVVSNDLPILRALGMFAGLLSLAVVFRLAKDYIDPFAGAIALVILASNHNFSYYIDYVRMYSCLVFASGLALWLYFCVTYGRKGSKRRWIALALAIFSLIMLHVYAAFFFLAMLSLYHIFVGQRKTRWSPISALALALLLSSPFLLHFATVGASAALNNYAQWEFFEDKPSLFEVARAYLTMVTNSPFALGQLALVVLPLAGFIFTVATRNHPFHTRLVLLALFSLPALAFSTMAGLVHIERLRFTFAILLPAVLAITVGLAGLARWRSWALMAVALYLIASLVYGQGSFTYSHISHVRRISINAAPIHEISRRALKADHLPLVLGFQYPRPWIKLFEAYENVYMEHFYFTKHGIRIELVSELAQTLQGLDTQGTPSIWAFYNISERPPDIDELSEFMVWHDYQLCRRSYAGKDAEILEYQWKTLPCES